MPCGTSPRSATAPLAGTSTMRVPWAAPLTITCTMLGRRYKEAVAECTTALEGQPNFFKVGAGC